MRPIGKLALIHALGLLAELPREFINPTTNRDNPFKKDTPSSTYKGGRAARNERRKKERANSRKRHEQD